ncbi:cobaltochelatase subunit CobN [Bryobacter aggregatus]|uniref:cobaltochelatase subunit CobN n=1 Tax=Bryobacter aggregatus TaxID=360054 RepID=UPI0005694321|nr:cobaltochelatase subunit CobN [Bryobacter aggregatus]
MRHLLFLLALSACAQPRAVLLLRSAQSAPAILTELQKEIPDFECTLAREDLRLPDLDGVQVLFLEHPSQDFLTRSKTLALEAIAKGMRVATDTPDLVQRAWGVEPSLALTRRLLPYFQNGGDANLRAFFRTAYREAGGRKQFDIPPPIEVPKTGIYHPDAPRLFPNLTDYLAWYRQAKPKQGRLAALGFFHTFLKNGDLAFIDAQLRALEKEGLAAAGIVGWPHHTLEKVFEAPAQDPLRVLLTFTLSLTRPEDILFLQKQNVHTISLITTRDNYATWAETPRGVSTDRIATSIANPESAGATDPILVATTELDAHGLAHTLPIPERIEMAARRARRWVSLADKPNAQKRLAILYYNNPPGKGNLGASYLNLPPSIEAVLKTLNQAGYQVGARIPTAGKILSQLEKTGRNVETWAPGELTKMIAEGGVTLLPVDRYQQWFRDLPQRFRDSINGRWGQPEAATLMTWKDDRGRKFFVIPGITLDNVFLGPQLLRASFAEYTNVQHSGTLPPHHGYVAAYLYYRHQFQADAVIHMGRHGTLEWLPGKNAGQAGWDCSEVILGDLPNLNYYIMDGDGEAVQARRRAAAVDLSHLTPMLVRAGKEDRFAALREAVNQWELTRETSPGLAAVYAKQATEAMAKAGIDKQIPLEEVSNFLESIEDAPIPLGLPTLGKMPSEDRVRAALATFLDSNFSPTESKRWAALIPDWANAIFDGTKPIGAPNAAAIDATATWLAKLRQSPSRELEVLIEALNAGFVSSAPVGDPIAVPAGLPTGRNLHQGDPSLLPTKAAWEVGKRMANQLLEQHKRSHGRYPERLSMVLWQGETGRHQGAMEAQALYLMGVEPEWNQRGVPDRLKLIPDAELGRPRVNVVFTVSGLYRDGLPDKILLLDRAAHLAASAGDNALSRQNRQTEAKLLAAGVDPKQAAAVAGARVFTTAPGAYGFGLEKFVEQSRDKDEANTMAELYLSKMNYVYTESAWGSTVPKLLESQLQGNEVILHSRSSNLYGAVDNDDVYQWMGGLLIASEAAGAKPELLVNNMRRHGDEKLESARNFIATELNARNWNPKWIAEMQKEGYSGAREMTKAVEHLYGWQATAPETIAPEAWKKMYDVYVADEYKLGLKGFFDQANPAMRQNLVARLLEIDRQGVYKFNAADKRQLLHEFSQLVSKNGVACSANTCGNQRLQQSVIAEASNADSQAVAKSFEEAVRPASRQKQAIAAPKPMPQINMIRVSNFARRARRVFDENPVLWLSLVLACLGAGAVSAFLRRHTLDTSDRTPLHSLSDSRHP